MKLPVIVFQTSGALFFINGFNWIWTFLVPAENLEVIRSGSSWSFYISPFSQISHTLRFISFFGLIGLLLACGMGLWICQKRGYAKRNVLAVFFLAFLLNDGFVGDLQFFEYRSAWFSPFSMHVYFVVHFLLAVLIGSGIFVFTYYLKYFKWADTGGVKG